MSRDYRGQIATEPNPFARPYDTEPDGLTVAEIAERLDLAESTVRLDLRTALEKMRRLLTEEK